MLYSNLVLALFLSVYLHLVYALSFYLSLGYAEKGPYQSDTGIPHSKMEKSLIS